MSVPVNQRTHGKLEAASKAFELATYTLRITKNKKVFTVEYQEALTDHIISTALDIYLLAKSANDLIVRTEMDKQNYIDRIEMQRQAHVLCGRLSSLILLAKPIFHLSARRVTYWTGLTKDTKALIKAWMDSDIKRFLPLFEHTGVG